MKISGIVDPVFANCAFHFGCIRVFKGSYWMSKIKSNYTELVSNDIIFINWKPNYLGLVDLKQLIQTLACFKEALFEEDPSYNSIDEGYDISAIYIYYKTVEKLYMDDLLSYGEKPSFYEKQSGELFKALQQIGTRCVSLNAGLFPYRLKSEYRKQGAALIKRMTEKGFSSSNLIENIMYLH